MRARIGNQGFGTAVAHGLRGLSLRQIRFVWMLVAEPSTHLEAHCAEWRSTLFTRFPARGTSTSALYRAIVAIVFLASAPNAAVIANVAIVNVATTVAGTAACHTGVHLQTLPNSLR
jgi:hypothetical protein